MIATNQIPDHATIARFRVRHQEALGELFGQILTLCGRAGIVDPSTVAADGSKFAAAAADGSLRTYTQIATEIIAEAGRIDSLEDEIHGTNRGDELPEKVRRLAGRKAWLKQAAAELEQERDENPEPVERDRATRLETCRKRLAEDLAAHHAGNEAYERYRAGGKDKNGRPFGRPPNPYTPPELPEGKMSVTDPDARRMKFGRNFRPGYNIQAATTEGQIIVAAEITTKGADFEQLDPVMRSAERELEAAGIKAKPGVVLADAGYWANEHIDALRERGMTPIVAPDTTRDKPRKLRMGGPYDFMRRVLAIDQGGELYSRRQWMVEPVFAQVKSNRRIDRLRRRGRVAARSEWRLIAATHNLLKLYRHQIAAQAA